MEVRIIPEESQLGTRGRKREAEDGRKREAEEDPSTSAVPPGSATAKARTQAEEKKYHESKGKGSTKGASKGSGKEPRKRSGTTPPGYEITPSDLDTSIQEKKSLVTESRQPFLERTRELIKKTLAAQSMSPKNIDLLEHTYVHWFKRLENVPMNIPLEVILTQLYDVELGSIMADFTQLPPNERRAGGERAALALRTIKKFVSSLGAIVLQFFEQDKQGGVLPEAALVRSDKPQQVERAKSSTVILPVEDKPEEQVTISSSPQEPAAKAESVEQLASPPEKQKASVLKGHDEQQEKEDDEDKDLQAALHASMQAPRSPQIDSGPQSSKPKGTSISN